MITNPFDDPFFTDPDYLKKKEKKFKRQFIIYAAGSVIASAIIFVFVFAWINAASRELENDKSIRKNMVGRKIVIDSDTLTIIDFNRWDENYTLSNGVKVDYKIAEKNLIHP